MQLSPHIALLGGERVILDQNGISWKNHKSGKEPQLICIHSFARFSASISTGGVGKEILGYFIKIPGFSLVSGT
jgi:hypothetical protein